LGLILILTTSVSAINTTTPNTLHRGDTLYVGGSGGGNYTRIQDAIDNATDGDTVFVFDDSSPYYENLVINTSISLIGEDRNTTIIDGLGENRLIRILANNVTINFFTIQNGHDGILLLSSNCFIKSNNIYNNTIYGISSNPHYSPTTGNIIANNIFQYNQNFALAMGGSEYCQIINNTFSDNAPKSGDDMVVWLTSSHNNLIIGNTFTNSNVTINRIGLCLDSSNRNVIANNSCK
jgi:parallel beta-helix repeat protein